jgi:hypothetical protein
MPIGTIILIILVVLLIGALGPLPGRWPRARPHCSSHPSFVGQSLGEQ